MGLREWQGIRRDTDDTTDDGAANIINPGFYIEGEIARRPGTTKFAAQSGTVMLNFYSVYSGYQVVFVSGDSVISLAAP